MLQEPREKKGIPLEFRPDSGHNCVMIPVVEKLASWLFKDLNRTVHEYGVFPIDVDRIRKRRERIRNKLTTRKEGT